MSQRRSKHLILILARELASNLATPTLIADDRGRLIYYNEQLEDRARSLVARDEAQPALAREGMVLEFP